MMPRIIELKEYQTKKLPAAALPIELGEKLWKTYGKEGIDVQFPSFRTGNQWEITAKGQVGYIPLSPEIALSLRPKVPIDNLFAMLEYAYDLKSFRFLEGRSQCHSLDDFYNRLADILARRILDRTRQGLHRSYIDKTERLTYLRGRLNIVRQIHRPWDVKLQCHYQEQTADIEDNQILLWTLRRIIHHGINRTEVATNVRSAYQTLHRTISLKSFSAKDCIGRTYHRLNDDYQTLHALCRFFLDQAGPSLQQGDRRILPFLVNMNQLFESFVAAWLKAYSRPLQDHGLTVAVQETVRLSDSLNFQIDLILSDITTGKARYVLDTKYKAPKSPSSSDVQQAIAYAETQGTTEAILIYPQKLDRPLHIKPNRVRVRSLAFPISNNIEQGGQNFINELLL